MKGRLSGKHRGQNPLRGLYHLDAIGLMGGECLQERMRVRIIRFQLDRDTECLRRTWDITLYHSHQP